MLVTTEASMQHGDACIKSEEIVWVKSLGPNNCFQALPLLLTCIPVEIHGPPGEMQKPTGRILPVGF